ncbi:unnamed protein product [Blepharisma stoltei]|uniref:RRM domain-containing protein n=1 Tax=Blepharisma stoltei TaxID=1481888 RepID=A0AAU9JZ67_9CILI|nr:unnamed protein product [Blepharisma stoltei]
MERKLSCQIPLHPNADTSFSSSPLSGSKLLQRQSKRIQPNPSELSKMRIIQSDLVYIINLPPSVADETLLKSYRYFGQYGKIKKCVVNKANAYTNGSSGVSYGAYITFSNEEESSLCIKACDEFVIEGKQLTVTFGTTKYCTYFLEGIACPKPECLYLHKLAPQSQMVPRDSMAQVKNIQPKNILLEKLKIVVDPPDEKTALPRARVTRDRSMTENFTKKNSFRPRIFSRDFEASHSRFNFVQEKETEEKPYDLLPKSVIDLIKKNSPCKETVEVLSDQYNEILSPSSPDKWANDILQVVDVKTDFSLDSHDQHIYVVAPKIKA